MLADLTFDPTLHEYRMRGERWPSVTEVLEPLLQLEGIPKAMLRAAADFGSNVHAACHLSNVGNLDWDSLDEELRPYVNAWRKFVTETGAVVLASELRIAHPKIKYAGTLDAIVRWKGRQHVLDIKTSFSVPRTTAYQTAAYYEAVRLTGRLVTPTRYCVHLRADATYRLLKLDNRSDFNSFISCLNFWRLLNAA